MDPVRRAHVVAFGLALVALAWAAGAEALRPPCAPEAGCMDESGPMSPSVARVLATAGALVCGVALALAGRVRAGWAAGFQLVVALLASVPLLVQRLPGDLAVWVVPTLATWGAFAALLLADRRRTRASQ